jgi:hypothetical protein
MSALNALLDGLVDFAGLFPPASLDMPAAVRAYESYRQGPHAGLLGAFVIPAMRLDEFEAALDAFEHEEDEGRAWPVSVIAGDLVDGDIGRALRFVRIGERGPAVRIASIEARAASAGAVMRLATLVPRAVMLAIEIPPTLAREERRAVLAAVNAAGRAAKLRTGGVTADAIPPPGQVAEFIWDCARAGVPFKATAGLHHPVRAEQPLTYAADSPHAVMHGFVNVFLSAALAWMAAQTDRAPDPPPAVVRILEERDPSAFTYDGAAIRWRGLAIPAAEIARARVGLARSFGSCSFVEPVSGLEALGWLPRP